MTSHSGELEKKLPKKTTFKLSPKQISRKALPGSSPHVSKRLVKTALHQAILDGRVRQVRLLVEKHGASINCKDVYGLTPTMLTSMADDETGAKMAKILIVAGADLSLKDRMGRTALSLACINGQVKIVDEILRNDILNINEPDNDGNTPLHHAASSGNPNIVQRLVDLFLKFGLDVDTRNKLGYTALLMACRHAHYVSAHYLLSKGNSSPALCDDETFLNANEWTHNSTRHVVLPTRPILIAPPCAPTFSRETSIYQRALTPLCKYSRKQNDLPTSARRDDTKFTRSETVLDGQDARQLVINNITIAQWITKTTKERRKVHPTTAKLLAISRRPTRSAALSDMTTLFALYSDQYHPDKRIDRKILTLHASNSNKMPLIIRSTSNLGA